MHEVQMSDNRIYFSKKDLELLKNNLPFYQSLDSGTRFLTSIAQEHFVSVCRGEAPIQTEHECVYLKYRAILYNREKRLKPEFDQQQQIKYMKVKRQVKQQRVKKGTQHKSRKYTKDVTIDKITKESERERISNIMLRQRKIRDAIF